MKPRWMIFLLLFAATVATAQTKISIPAGTPEDQALQPISNEGDNVKKAAMLTEYVSKFASNPAAVAYGDWQLAQLAQMSGDLPKALELGDKALAAMPDVMDILMFQADLAQQMKDYTKVVDYSSRAAAVYVAASKRPKPEGMSDDDFNQQMNREKADLQPAYDYVETSAYNAIVAEQNPKPRMGEIEKYLAAFPGSKFAEPTATLAVVTLQQMNDASRLAEFSEKVLAKNPNDLRMLAILASAFADDEKNTQLPKAVTYARKAIDLAKDKNDVESKRLAGIAHSALGYALLKQDKATLAVPEFKTAAGLLKDEANDYAKAEYLLGYTYGKLNQAANAKAALAEAAKLDSPYQKPAKDLLAKINAATGR